MERLDSILQAHVAQGEDTVNKLFGAAFVVTDGKDIIYSGSAGRLGPSANEQPFDDRTFGWVASMTKIVTATAIMQLVERGAMHLDDDVRGLVPELQDMEILRGFDKDDNPIIEINKSPITLRHLLTHTLGLGYDLADPDLVKWGQKVGRTAHNLCWSRDGFTCPLKFAPGEGWYYGGAMDFAALALEAVTGQKLSAYTQEHIFDPLGIQDTGFWPEKLPHTASRTVKTACRTEDGALREGPAMAATPTVGEYGHGVFLPPTEHEVESGGAGLFSTAHDYVVFLRGLLAGRLVGEDTLKLMFTPQLDDAQAGMLNLIAYTVFPTGFAPEFPTGLPLNHGLSGIINMEDVPGKRRKGSLTWSGMCNSRWWIDRETGIAPAMIINVQPFGDTVAQSLWNDLELAVYEFLGKRP